MTKQQVCPQIPVSRSRLSAAISAGWSRVSNRMGRGCFADAAGMDDITARRAIAGPSLPSAENLLNSLCADPTALSEVLALYGVQLTPIQTEVSSDMELAAKIGSTLSEYLERLRDGKRCHVDTAVLAVLFRDLIPQMQAIVSEDDRRKGLRAVS